MLVSELIVDINYAHKGNNRAPTEGSDKWNRTLAIVNRKLREWASDSNTAWTSLFEEDNIGVFSTTQSYPLSTDTQKLSDFVYLRSGTRELAFNVVPPQRRAEYSNAVYVSGNPKTLTFTDATAATHPFIGANIIVPCYKLPTPLTAGTDEVRIDSHEWLTYAVAAELARNDPAKDDQFGNLIGMANDLYQQMKDNNNVLPYAQPFDIPVEVMAAGESW